MKLLNCIWVLLLILLATGAQSQTIQLTTGKITLAPPQEGEKLNELTLQATYQNDHFYIVRFSGKPAGGTVKNWQPNRVEILEKLADNTYVIKTNQTPDKAWFLNNGIEAIGILPPALKLEKRLQQGTVPGFASDGSGGIKILIGCYESNTSYDLKAALEQVGLQITKAPWSNAFVFAATGSLASIQKAASLPFVYYIQLQNPPDQRLNNEGRALAGAMPLQMPVEKGGKGLTGAGVTLGVGDDADPTLHPDLRDRVINHTPGITNNHGTHVTGTAAGAGILVYRLAGFAPMATVVSQWFSGIWHNAAIYAQAYNMVVTNNSYGSVSRDCEYAGVYDLYSRLLDLQAATLPQILHTFASGNDGDFTCSPFPKSYYTVLGGYQSAKNIITAGRTDYNQLASGSSSSGPVRDGRLKPEITALGIIESSNGAGTGYFVDFGTSMSAPSITGGLALLYQRYYQLKGGANPPGALMKALLLNGARDAGTPGPDYRHGYGAMMLPRSLRMLEGNHWSMRNISNGQVQDSIITVLPGTQQLKVMLYWHDPAAAALATNTLVHDLDLEVISPGGQTILPTMPNPAPASVMAPAIAAADHINNHEQVVITNPVPGNYTIRVRGTEVMTAPTQAYAIAFDYLPQELKFSFPLEGTAWTNATVGFTGSLPIAWEDEGNGNNHTYTLEYSLDDGANWTLITNTLKDTTRVHYWNTGSIRSPQARLRISKNGATTISGKFALIPNVSFSVAGVNDQCEGYFRINWNLITPQAGETIDYEVWMKKGPAMEKMATVADTNTYTIKGLHPDSTYYAAVVARINGVAGIYERAIVRRPNTGNCQGTISDGDLKVDSILSPKSGRQFTSIALTASEPVVVRIKNLDNAPANSFLLKYNINGGAFTEATINTPVAANSTYTHTFDPANFANPGTYTITAIIQNLAQTDLVSANDTLRVSIQNLPNQPISLVSPFLQNFEDATIETANRPIIGFANLTHWDYSNQDRLARARSYVTPGIALSGNKAITLDVSKAPPHIQNPANLFTGTFNLGSYSAANDEVRLALNYKHHGPAQLPHANNKVWVRGNDANPWIEVYDLGLNQPVLSGAWKKVPALEISDALAGAGQTFSTSTQVRFGQFSAFSMADNTHFGGYTFDDISLFIAQNDVQMLAITAPGPVHCALGSNTQVTILVKNSMPLTISNIPVQFRVSGGAWITETISSIAGNSELSYTFTTPADLSATGKLILEARTALAGDNVPDNDLQVLEIINQPVVNSFPYFEDFENGNGSFIASGINSSWQYGTPASLRINKAASGQNAWKTTLIGNYNDNEKSYLYTPCFDLNGLTNPTLSFSMAYQLEDCRAFNLVCDAAWVEYSTNGTTWQKLGLATTGTNWYDYATAQVWMATNKTHWHVATSPLPAVNGPIQLRFVLQSDDGVTREGVAIDDIHIYEGGKEIYTGPAHTPPLQQNVAGTQQADFLQDGKLVASILPRGENIGNTAVKGYMHNGPVRYKTPRYFANRNLVISPANQPNQSPVTLRYYFTDAEVDSLRNANTCSTCIRIIDYTDLGVLRYSNNDKALLDSSLENNNDNGLYTFISKDVTRLIPFANGYYAEVPVSSFSEFWLTNGPLTDVPLPGRWLLFTATLQQANAVALKWQVENQANTQSYIVEVAEGDNAGQQQNFVAIATIPANGLSSGSYSYIDNRPGKKGPLFYRIVQVQTDGTKMYSPTRQILLNDLVTRIKIFPNPAGQHLNISGSNLGEVVFIKLMSADGRVLYSREASSTNGSLSLQIPLQPLALPAGIYLLEVQDATIRKILKWIKE